MTSRSFISEVKKRDRLEWTQWLARQVEQLPPESRSFIKLDPFKSFGFTDIRHGRSGNQDRAVVAYRSSSDSSENWYLAVVCDGVGGSLNGERAAALACASLVAEISASHKTAPLAVLLHNALEETHKVVCAAFEKRSSTTLAAFVVKGDQSAICWIGDSRVYQLSHQVTLITRDDTLKTALELAGNFAEELNEEFAERLSQAIGGDCQIKPNVSPLMLSSHDDYLLCSDGVWKPLTATLQDLTANCPDRAELTRRLLLTSDWHGGKDNATAIVLPSPFEIKSALLRPTNYTPVGCCAVCLPGGTQLFVPKLETASYATQKQGGVAKGRGATPSESTTVAGAPQEKAVRNRNKKATTQLLIEEEIFDDAPQPTGPIQADKAST